MLWQVICPIDSEDFRSAATEFKSYAQSSDRVLSIHFIKSKEQLNSTIIKSNVRIGIVCGWYSILTREILEIPQYKFWGIHHSLLPKYRGFSPLVWSVINGDEELGSTIFQITPEMDAGDYVAQIRVKNQENASIGQIMGQVESRVLIELLKNWEELKTGRAKLYAQDVSKITLAKKRTDADGRIRWNDSAKQVHNFIRAQSKPYPGAYFYLQDSKFRVYESEIADISHAIAPGVVLELDESMLRVSCGKGTAINLPLRSIESREESEVNKLRVGLNLNQS